MKRVFVFIAVVLVVGVFAKIEQNKVEDILHSFQPPDGATNVAIKPNFLTRSGSLNFQYPVAYPSLYPLSFIAAQLKKQGWNKCTQTKLSWQTYLSYSNQSNARKVFRRSEFWYKKNVLFTLTATYYSNKLKYYRPDNTDQYVSVLLEFKDDLVFEKTNFGVICPE